MIKISRKPAKNAELTKGTELERKG